MNPLSGDHSRSISFLLLACLLSETAQRPPTPCGQASRTLTPILSGLPDTLHWLRALRCHCTRPHVWHSRGYSAHIPTSRPSTLTLASHRNDALGSNNTFTIVVLICFQNVVFTSRYSLTTHMQLFINYVYSVVGSHYSTLPQRYLFHF
jgi:hypothetical protein